MRRPATECPEQTAAPETLAAELLRRMARGDRAALHAFYRLYARRIGAFLTKLLKRPELVDEAVNDTLLAVWQNAGEYDPARGRLSTWLFGIAYRKGLKLLESTRRHRTEPVENDAGDPEDGLAGIREQRAGADPERTILGWELGELLDRALAQLSPEQRGALELTFAEGYSYQEIAAITQCPVNTVKTRVFHARRKLFQILERQGYTPAGRKGS